MRRRLSKIGENALINRDRSSGVADETPTNLTINALTPLSIESYVYTPVS